MPLDHLQGRIAETEKDVKAIQKDLSERLISRVADNERDVKVLEKEAEMQNRIFIKLEETVQKIQDLTESMHRLISIHDEKIRVQEKSIETYRNEMKDEMKELERRISNETLSLCQKIDRVEHAILMRLAEMQKVWNTEKVAVQVQKETFSDKVQTIKDKMEGYKWFILGSIFAAGMLAGHADLLGAVLHIFS